MPAPSAGPPGALNHSVEPKRPENDGHQEIELSPTACVLPGRLASLIPSDCPDMAFQEAVASAVAKSDAAVLAEATPAGEASVEPVSAARPSSETEQEALEKRAAMLRAKLMQKRMSFPSVQEPRSQVSDDVTASRSPERGKMRGWPGDMASAPSPCSPVAKGDSSPNAVEQFLDEKRSALAALARRLSRQRRLDVATARSPGVDEESVDAEDVATEEGDDAASDVENGEEERGPSPSTSKTLADFLSRSRQNQLEKEDVHSPTKAKKQKAKATEVDKKQKKDKAPAPTVTDEGEREREKTPLSDSKKGNREKVVEKDSLAKEMRKCKKEKKAKRKEVKVVSNGKDMEVGAVQADDDATEIATNDHEAAENEETGDDKEVVVNEKEDNTVNEANIKREKDKSKKHKKDEKAKAAKASKPKKVAKETKERNVPRGKKEKKSATEPSQSPLAKRKEAAEEQELHSSKEAKVKKAPKAHKNRKSTPLKEAIVKAKKDNGKSKAKPRIPSSEKEVRKGKSGKQSRHPSRSRRRHCSSSSEASMRKSSKPSRSRRKASPSTSKRRSKSRTSKRRSKSRARLSRSACRRRRSTSFRSRARRSRSRRRSKSKSRSRSRSKRPRRSGSKRSRRRSRSRARSRRRRKSRSLSSGKHRKEQSPMRHSRRRSSTPSTKRRKTSPAQTAEKSPQVQPAVMPPPPLMAPPAPEGAPPCSLIRLTKLETNADLNGVCGVVLPFGISKAPEVKGAVKARLENGREVAVRPANMELLSLHTSPGISAEQEQRLQIILHQIQLEVRANSAIAEAMGLGIAAARLP